MGRIPEGTEIEGGYKSPKINYLWPHHKTMARMVVAGATPGEVAATMGFSKGQVSRVMGSPAFQSEIARLECGADEVAIDLHEDIKKIAPRALEVLDGHINMEPETIQEKTLQQRAAFDILDRGGYGKKIESTGKSLNLHLHKEITEMDVKDLQEDLFSKIEEN